MDAKAEILGRITACHVPATTAERASVPSPEHEGVVERFAEHVAEYRANVMRVSAEGVGRAISKALQTLSPAKDRIVVPSGFPAEWISAGYEFVEDQGFDHRTLDGFGAVVTGCAVAIAETGTVVLVAGPAQGRRAISLIPDHHVCVVRADQVVRSVPEAVARLAPFAVQRLPMTWISGPSATSDIELSRVEGVHGPRRLDIVIVDV